MGEEHPARRRPGSWPPALRALAASASGLLRSRLSPPPRRPATPHAACAGHGGAQQWRACHCAGRGSRQGRWHMQGPDITFHTFCVATQPAAHAQAAVSCAACSSAPHAACCHEACPPAATPACPRPPSVLTSDQTRRWPRWSESWTEARCTHGRCTCRAPSWIESCWRRQTFTGRRCENPATTAVLGAGCGRPGRVTCLLFPSRDCSAHEQEGGRCMTAAAASAALLAAWGLCRDDGTFGTFRARTLHRCWRGRGKKRCIAP